MGQIEKIIAGLEPPAVEGLTRAPFPMVEDNTDVEKEFQYLHDVAKRMRLYHKEHGEYRKENLWTAFYDAMMRHSYNYENDSLYEDMKNTFFTRIQNCRS